MRSRVVLITRMLMYNVPLLREGSTLFLFAKIVQYVFLFLYVMLLVLLTRSKAVFLMRKIKIKVAIASGLTPYHSEQGS